MSNKQQLNEHLHTYGYVNHTQVDSAIYHAIKEHEERHHKPRFKFNIKTLLARGVLFVLWVLGLSSYFLWPSPDTRSWSIFCAILFILPVSAFLVITLVSTAMGDDK